MSIQHECLAAFEQNIPSNEEVKGLKTEEGHQIEGLASNSPVNHQQCNAKCAEIDTNADVQIFCKYPKI